MSEAVVRFDGGCRPTNPGHAAFAVVVELEGNQLVLSRYIGWKTNNDAEYMGCIVGIKMARDLGATSITVMSDSQLVVNQVSGEWNPKQAKMKSYCAEARNLLDKHFAGKWKIIWNRRSQNTLADEHCTSAINWGRNQNPWTPQKIKDNRPGTVIDPFLRESG